MLAHVLAVLGLAIYAFEVYRTVLRFGVKRPGMLGTVMLSAPLHVFMAVVMAVGFVVLGSTPLFPVPAYVAPVGVLINLVYLVMALRHARRQARARAERSERYTTRPREGE